MLDNIDASSENHENENTTTTIGCMEGRDYQHTIPHVVVIHIDGLETYFREIRELCLYMLFNMFALFERCWSIEFCLLCCE